MNWNTIYEKNTLLQIRFQVLKKISIKLNLRNTENTTLITYSIQNSMRQNCSIKIKGYTVLKTIFMIGKSIQMRDPVRYVLVGNIKSLLILNSYFIGFSSTCCPHPTIKLWCWASILSDKSFCRCSFSQYDIKYNQVDNFFDVQWWFGCLQ